MLNLANNTNITRLMSNKLLPSRGILACCLFVLIPVLGIHGLDKLKHGARLSHAGLGNDLELMVPIDNPFASSGSLKLVEAMPDSNDESLKVEAVPPELRSHDSAGQFYLPSSILQVTRSGDKSRALSPEYREVDYLNRLVEGRVPTVSSNLLQTRNSRNGRDRDPVAMEDAAVYGGAPSVDFKGPCALGYSPFKKVAGKSLDECWSSCREYSACTQVHFDEEAESCYLSQGISSNGAKFVELSDSMEECRSLTPVGLTSLFGLGSLPPFRILADTELYLISNTSVSIQLAVSLAECQSACIDRNDCHFGAWIDGRNDCYLAEAVSNKCILNDCHKVGGDTESILFERNLANMVYAKGLTGEATSKIPFPESESCERRCRSSFDSESACVTLCLVEARSACQMHCLTWKREEQCVGVSLSYGNFSNQTCFGFSKFTKQAEADTTDHPIMVDVFVLPAELRLPSRVSFLEGTSEFLGPSGNLPSFTQYIGACDIFHEGVSLGSGSGISQFSALSISECWNLCLRSQCSQIQFNSATNLCVLGDAMASQQQKSDSSSNVICRSLNSMPSNTSNGLSGMMLVDSVGSQRRNNSNWFSGAAQPVLVTSIYACQAICKMADTQASDSVCRFGGYQACSSFYSSLCSSAAASAECNLCKGNPDQGICRIPQINVAQPGAATYAPSNAAQQALSRTPIPCLGGKCVWFEKGAVGFSLQVSTPSVNTVNYLPSKDQGFVCATSSYLPPLVIEKSAIGRCFYPAESLWHCQKLCSLVNLNNGTLGNPACIGGLYTDSYGSKQCRLARYRLTSGRPCTGLNCAWFELSGLGKTATLFATGTNLADESRQQPLPSLVGRGACQQFRAMQAVITNTPAGFQFSPVEDCTRACLFFPQCSSFQLTGSLSGTSNSSACDVVAGSKSNCTFITCTLSTAISLPTPTTALNTLCWTKTPAGLNDQGDAGADMDLANPGLPGFTTTNARVRKFSWNSVINQNNLILAPSLEECQATCRVSDACIAGSWQSCKAIEGYCPPTADAPASSPELAATCDACRKVYLSPAQPSVQFPDNLGVCKQASAVNLVTEGCNPEPCYAFEEGGENYFILSMSKSPFIKADGSLNDANVLFLGEPKAYKRTQSVVDCENLCTQDPACRYGHFETFTNGYGNCYLTSSEIRVTDGSSYKLNMPNPCTGSCIVFIKLPTALPRNMMGSQGR